MKGSGISNDLGIRAKPEDWVKPVFWRGAQHFHDWKREYIAKQAQMSEAEYQRDVVGVDYVRLAIENWGTVDYSGCSPYRSPRRLPSVDERC